MAELVKLISKIPYGDGAKAAITLVGSANSYAPVIFRADDKSRSTAQLWRREPLSVSGPNGDDWVGYAFTMPVAGQRWALQYNGPNTPVTAAPYGPQVAQQLWRLAYQDWPYAVLGMFDPVHPIFLNLYSGIAKDGQPIYSWTENNGQAQPNEYWLMEHQKNIDAGEVPGVAVPEPIQTVRAVFHAAQANKDYFQLLLSDPAEVFDAAGYSIPSEYYTEFNKYYREHNGVQALHSAIAAGQPLESVADASCVYCQIGCFVVALAITVIGAAAATLVTAGAAPVVALVTFTGLSAVACQAFIIGLAAGAVFTLVYVVSQICAWLGLC